MMASPLFVLGKQRSGTTWLSNQLCEHSLIAGVQHEHHRGIHESAYFYHIYNRFGDLKYRSNFVEFVEVMAASDTFRLIGVDKAFLYSLFPTSYEGVFQAVMSRFAEAQGAQYWLDKTPQHALLVGKLAELYPDAKFIGIIRNVEDVAHSTVAKHQLGERARRKELVRLALSWARTNSAMEHFAKTSDRIKIVHYEALREDPERVYHDLCAFLELEFESAMLDQAYDANTSFARSKGNKPKLHTRDRRLVRVAAGTARFLPLNLLASLKVAPLFRKRKTLPPWFFSMSPFVQEIDTRNVAARGGSQSVSERPQGDKAIAKGSAED